MKQLIKNSLLVILFSTSLLSFASGASPYVKVKRFDGKKFVVIVKSANPTDLQISLRDRNDFELYAERHADVKDGYAKKFDVADLPDGSYFLEIENAQKIDVYSLEIAQGKLSIESDNRVAIFKPQVFQKGNQVDIAMLKYLNVPMKFSILNNTNDIIYEDTLADSQSVNKRYDMSKLDPGIYTLRFNLAGRLFTKSIDIQ
ncbi:hypothetical protein [Fulvivirga sediminis]|uniref:Por secretion system C-terminal sorting domain-containing protein n=1 Tax=Fulvivirga sediminis TaxID=2803949 RepID=A0A937F5G7_9BACT|nr:hypothetical protein [Fulvivirga sediminis]MBL3654675.1 hypothetical protein [Fulvivirga sediminis]